MATTPLAPYDARVQARVSEFLTPGKPWNRRLWTLGLILSCREVLEAAQPVADGAIWADSVATLKAVVSAMAAKDAGVATGAELAALQSSLRANTPPGGHGHRVLTQLVSDIQGTYVSRWISALTTTSQSPPLVERTARSFASHLLDDGFSPTFLVKWFEKLRQRQPTAGDLWREAASLLDVPCPPRQVLVPFSAAPDQPDIMPREWLDSKAVSYWLVKRRFPRERQVGGFLFTLYGTRDEWAAVERAGELVDAVRARVALASKATLEPVGRAWVDGYSRSLPLKQHRGLTVSAIARSGTTYVVDPNSRVDSALQLMSELGYGAPTTLVATAWAALESLLFGPGDKDRGVAADRCADIVMCSLPRAEFTTLAHAHIQASNSTDAIAADLVAVGSSNRRRASVIEEVVRTRRPLALEDPADQGAYDRLRDLVHQPTVAFPATREYMVTALRRLFRQRNIVLHSGQLESVALRPGLRIAAPLVVEGMNMIAYHWLRAGGNDHHVDPLELAALAHLRLQLVSSALSRPLYDLLGS